MQDAGFRTSLWCVDGSPLHQSAIDQGVEIELIKRHRKYLPLRAAVKLSKRLSRSHADVVWVRDTRDMSVSGWAKSFSARPFLLVYQQAMQLGISKRDWVHTVRFSKIDVWVAPLQYLAEQVKTHTRFPAERIHVIPLAVSVERFKQLPERQDARTSFGLPYSGVVMGMVGRLDRLKGQDFIIKRFIDLRDQGYTFSLLIVGEATRNEGEDYEKELHSLADNSKYSNDIYFIEHISDVERAYAAIDLFVMASEGETFGMVTIEAMAAGCTVIGTNRSGTPELLGYGTLGALYEPGDAASFLAAASPLLDNPETRTAYAQKGRQHALKTFNREKVISQLSNLISEKQKTRD